MIEGTWAALCPTCERHFTRIAEHAARGCDGPGPMQVDFAGIRAPEFGFDRWVEIFWSRVERGTPDECWPWRNAINSAGYGVMLVPKEFRARLGAPPSGLMCTHRIAWALANDEALPRGGVICHRCDDSRPCCNPAHLYLGNAGENGNDLAAKNRRRAPR